MFIRIGDKLKNIAGYTEISPDAEGKAVLTKKEGNLVHQLSTTVDFEDLVKQMQEGGMLITPARKRPEMAKTHPVPVKKPEAKKPEPVAAAKAPTKPATPSDAPKLDLTKKPAAPETEKPKVVEAKKPAAPTVKVDLPKVEPTTPAVNEGSEPDYIGKVDDRNDSDNGNGDGGK